MTDEKNEQVERVARAIAKEMLRSDQPISCESFNGVKNSYAGNHWGEYAEQAKAAIAAATEWQDISTAPKDGTVILVNNTGDGYRTEDEVIGSAKWSTLFKKEGAWSSNACCDGVSYYTPTHWMPLPPAPPAQEGE